MRPVPSASRWVLILLSKVVTYTPWRDTEFYTSFCELLNAEHYVYIVSTARGACCRTYLLLAMTSEIAKKYRYAVYTVYYIPNMILFARPEY